MRERVDSSFLKIVDTKVAENKLAAKNANVRTSTLDKCIVKIDKQIEECIAKAKNLNMTSYNNQAYIYDEAADEEGLFINNIKDCGWIDFYRKNNNIWCRCQIKNGPMIFYQAGPMFEQQTGAKYLIIEKSSNAYKAYTNTSNVSDKMKKTDTFYKMQKAYFNFMWNERASFYRKNEK